MKITQVGMGSLMSSLGQVKYQLSKAGRDVVTNLSYRGEYEAKLRVPVWSGRLFSSIGGKLSLTRIPIKGSDKLLNPSEQNKGRGEAIWERKRHGFDWSVTYGTKTPYAHLKENQQSIPAGHFKHGHMPQPHFMYKGALAALGDAPKEIDAAIHANLGSLISTPVGRSLRG